MTVAVVVPVGLGNEQQDTRTKRKHAFSMWGYEVSACQSCGRASIISPCRLCAAPPLTLVAGDAS